MLFVFKLQVCKMFSFPGTGCTGSMAINVPCTGKTILEQEVMQITKTDLQEKLIFSL